MKNQNPQINPFSKSLKIDLSGFNADTALQLEKLISHFKNTNRLLFIFAILVLAIGIPLEFKGIKIYSLISVLAGLFFWMRYLDLFRKFIFIIIKLNSEPEP
jgi:hypothetical protein